MLPRGRAVVVAGVVALGLVATPWRTASAQAAPKRDPAAAEALFREGQALMKAGNCPAAVKKLAASEEADPGAGTAMSLARCLDIMGDLAASWATWQEALTLLAPNDERRPAAVELAAEVERRVPRLTLRLREGSPADATVTRDGAVQPRGSLGAALPVNPGVRTLRVTAAGHEPAEVQVTLAEGDRKEVEVGVGPARAEAAAPAPAPPKGWPVSRSVGVAVGAVGVAGIVGAVVTGVVLAGKKSDVERVCDARTKVCTNPSGVDAASSAKPLLVVNAVSWGVGVVGLGLGATLVITSYGARTGTAVAPAVGGVF